MIEELNPGSGKSEYIKGLSLINLGRTAEACESFKAADAYRYKEAKQALANHCGS